MPTKKDAAYWRDYRARKAATAATPVSDLSTEAPPAPGSWFAATLLAKEARASVALDHDPLEGTQSVLDARVDAEIQRTGQTPSRSVQRRVRAQLDVDKSADVPVERGWRNPYDDGLPDWPELIGRMSQKARDRLLEALPQEKRRG